MDGTEQNSVEQTKKLNEYGNHTLVRVGDVVWGWCSRCCDRADHLYTGYSLICLGCHPEMRRAQTDER